jgi:hypothetical protein
MYHQPEGEEMRKWIVHVVTLVNQQATRFAVWIGLIGPDFNPNEDEVLS